MADRGEIRSLTGLRGVAACYVVAYHFLQSSAKLGVLQSPLLHGYIAVDLFFALSGFVIAMIYGQPFARGTSVAAYRGFLVRRLGRVYPLYLAATLFGIALATASSRALPFPQVVANLLMVQTWGIADSIVGPSWSISTEFAAYLIFPLLAPLVLGGTRTRVMLVAATAIAVLVVIGTRSSATLHQVYGGSPLRHGPLDIFGAGTVFPLLRCLAGFVLGMVAFRVRDTPAAARLGRFTGVIVAAIVAGLAVPGSDLVLVLLFAPLVVALHSNDGSITAKVLASPVAHWLGLVSFSIYLVHPFVSDLAYYPILGVLADVPHAATAARLATAALVLIVATATYHGIEAPARDAIRHLLQRRRARLA